MPKASPIQTSFNAGEWSPLLKGRVDLQKYANACQTLTNFMPLVQGPVKKRPGTRFVAEVKTSADNTRLLPFQFNVEQAYVLEFGDLYVRFYMDGGQIQSGGSPYEIVSPYGEDELDALQYAQSADVMYLAHPNHPPYKLTRSAHDSWTLAEVDFTWVPFSTENATTTTITPSAVTGSITLTASAALFSSSDIGRHIKLRVPVESIYKKWKPNSPVSYTGYRYYNGRVYQDTTSGTHDTGYEPPVHDEGTYSDGQVDWEYIHDEAGGYALITGYTSTTVVSATVVKTLPQGLVGVGTEDWTWGAWDETNGYPRAVTFYEDRLWFAGTNTQPQTVWASVTSDYERFKEDTVDDASLQYTISSREVNVIQWMTPGKVLAVGTSGGELIIRGSNLEDAITPTNVRIVPQTAYGSGDIAPLQIGNVTVFVQRGKRKLREYVYDFQTDSYTATDLTRLSEHMTDYGLIATTYQQSPDQIVWMPCACGGLFGMTYERAEDVVGWHRQTVSGSIRSITTIPHWDEDQDSVWMVVERTINGATVKYIEYFEKYLTDEYAFFVDCGLTYDGAAVTVISGLDHLEGEEVAILADGSVHPSQTVSSGSITLDVASSVVNVGLPYTAVMMSMPLEAGAADGTAQGKTKRINNVKIRLHETGPGLWVGSESIMDEYHPREGGSLMGQPVPLLSGDTDLIPYPEGYETEAAIRIEHRLPTPCTIVAVMPQVNTYDR